MKQILSKICLTLFAAVLLLLPQIGHAEGITASGGGDKTVGQIFTVNVVADGANFDALIGSISVTGPVETVSFNAGNAIWMPGRTPSNNTQFAGIVKSTNNFTIATITLKALSTGAGSVKIRNAKLASRGEIVSEITKGTDFFIKKNLSFPDAPIVTSASHPDQEKSYTSQKIDLSWEKSKGVIGYSYLLDTEEKTEPETKSTLNNTSISFSNKAPGDYYFHIRAVNADGWSETSTYKISIIEPGIDVTNAEVLGATAQKGVMGLATDNLPLFALIVGFIMIAITIALVAIYAHQKDKWL